MYMCISRSEKRRENETCVTMLGLRFVHLSRGAGSPPAIGGGAVAHGSRSLPTCLRWQRTDTKEADKGNPDRRIQKIHGYASHITDRIVRF